MLVSLARLTLGSEKSAVNTMKTLSEMKATLVRVRTKGLGRRATVMLAPKLTAEQRKAVKVLVEFIDLPRVATDGKDDHEAMEEAIDALGSDLSIRLSRKEEIPAPSGAKRGRRLVPVPLWLAPKLALYLAMGDQQVSNTELARRLGFHERARRMLDPEHASKAEKSKLP